MGVLSPRKMRCCGLRLGNVRNVAAQFSRPGLRFAFILSGNHLILAFGIASVIRRCHRTVVGDREQSVWSVC